jgi:hypothetical protein
VGYNRFGVNGVKDHPPEYDSEYADTVESYDDTHFAKVDSATSSTSFIDHSLTVDFENEQIVSISRGNTSHSLGLDMRYSGDTYRVLIGNGRGHEAVYNQITLRSGKSG